MKTKFIILTAFLLIFVYGCVQTAVEDKTNKPVEVEEEVEELIEVVEEEPKIIEASVEVKKLLNLASEKVTSISYKYKGPETNNYFYKFDVMGDELKYTIDPVYNIIDLDEDAYDAIYINKELEKAVSSCDDKQCKVLGEKTELNYNDNYIMTPFDWLESIESAEKTGEENIEKRNTWIITTQDSARIWVDLFSGVPVQVEFGGNKYQFMQMVLDGVTEEDVTLN